MINTDINTTVDFESIMHQENDVQFWYARELMPLLEYTQWRNFHAVIIKAKETVRTLDTQIENHFVEVSKMINIAAGSEKETIREIVDYKLTRHACYLVAQNGDTRKKSIALAQSYFATQTRKQEILEEKKKNIERIISRRKLSETEKKFAGVLNERGLKGKDIATIKSAGDEALFGQPTKTFKQKLGISEDKPLADFLPTISIKAKDLAMEMTTFNTQKKDIPNNKVKGEHIGNNFSVRKMLNDNGIYPERLPAEIDIKKLERKISEEEILEISQNKLLSLDKLEIDITGVDNAEEIAEIGRIIKNNAGHSKLVIYYGKKDEVKILERDIQINGEVINALKRYLVISNSN